MSEQTAVDEEVSIVWDEDGQSYLIWGISSRPQEISDTLNV